MSYTLKRTLIIATGAVLAVSGASVFALADDGAQGEPGVETVVSALSSPALVDRLPHVAATEIGDIGLPGIREDASIRALSKGESALYLTPATDGVCMSLVDGTGATASCVPREGIEGGSGRPSPNAVLSGCVSESAGAAPECEAATLYGVVPDGVDRVALAGGQPDAPSAEVVNNAYLLEVPAAQVQAPVVFQ